MPGVKLIDVSKMSPLVRWIHPRSRHDHPRYRQIHPCYYFLWLPYILYPQNLFTDLLHFVFYLTQYDTIFAFIKSFTDVQIIFPYKYQDYSLETMCHIVCFTTFKLKIPELRVKQSLPCNLTGILLSNTSITFWNDATQSTTPHKKDVISHTTGQ